MPWRSRCKPLQRTNSFYILSFLGRSPFSLYPGLSLPQSSSAASREDFLPPGSHLSGHGAGSVTQLGHSSYTVLGTSARCWRQRGKRNGALTLIICWGARPGCRSQWYILTALRWMEGQGARGEPSSDLEVARASCPLAGRGTCSTLEWPGD